MRDLADESVQTCVTSPPYFGLRDYGVSGQMGLEATPDEFVAGMVDVFREVRRVLRDDGTLWLNIGDSYTSGGRKSRAPDRKNSGRAMSVRPDTPTGLRPKELIGIPWRLAFALQLDGWLLRQEIIWNKVNAQPEPVKDRCTRGHESLFLLTKLPSYYFDAKAIAEDATCERKRGSGPMFKAGTGRADATTGTVGDYRANGHDGKRNKRSVWSIPTESFPEAHFATFPTALVEPCVLAGSREGDTVLDPFGGAGTTALVADRLHRNAILCELNPEYAAIAERRLWRETQLLADVRVE